jgi:hypothetical protein
MNFSARRLSLYLLLLSLLLMACRLGTAVEGEGETAVSQLPFLSADTDENATATPLPPGFSRTNPYPFRETAVLNNWEVEAVKILRGDNAWQEIHLANDNNQPPPEGEEYLLLKLRVKNNSLNPEEATMIPRVTGDKRVVYYSFNAGVVNPEPWLETELSGRSESDGWTTFLIAEGEHDLMLYLDDYEDYTAPPVYLALEENAAVSTDGDTLRGIEPTDLGISREQPVPFGETAVGEDWQVTIQDVITGEAAWEIILDANQFNDPPPKGMEYILIKAKVRNISLEEGDSLIQSRDFSLLTNSGEALDIPSVVEPKPELYFNLYPGGEAEGWMALQAPEKAKNLVLFFSPDSSAANDRYFSLGQGR